MARPQLAADFFVTPSGDVLPKAPPLKRSHARRIYERDEGVCQICHEPVRFGGQYDTPFDLGPKSGAVDHIIPRARGGQNDDENLRLLCKSCNSSRQAAL